MLPSSTKAVGELHSAQHAVEKAKNGKMFLLMLTNVQFLARQRLALRGDGTEFDSTFIQLTHLRRNDVSAWLDRRANKHTSPEVQHTSVCSVFLYTVFARSARQSLALHVQCNGTRVLTSQTRSSSPSACAGWTMTFWNMRTLLASIKWAQ